MKIEILTSHKDILGIASMKDGDPREVNVHAGRRGHLHHRRPA